MKFMYEVRVYNTATEDDFGLVAFSSEFDAKKAYEYYRGEQENFDENIYIQTIRILDTFEDFINSLGE